MRCVATAAGSLLRAAATAGPIWWLLLSSPHHSQGFVVPIGGSSASSSSTLWRQQQQAHRHHSSPHSPCGCLRVNGRHPAAAPPADCKRQRQSLLFSAGSSSSQLPVSTDGYTELVPGGCYKKILQPGDGSGRHPSPGDKVFVHYTICVADGAVFVDSSRDETGHAAGSNDPPPPFDFYLGRNPSEAIKGWDVAVPTMERGERVSLLCAPEFAYGKAGAPPKIPPSSTLECELELVDWVDVNAQYAQYSRPGETHDDRMERWEREIETGTSPIKADVGPQPGIRTATADEMLKGKMVDINDPAVKRAAAKQLVCGHGDGYSYLEKGTHLDLYVPVPEGTTAAQVLCDIHPQRLAISLLPPKRQVEVGRKVEVERVLSGALHGRVSVEGSYWCMSDRAPEAFDGSSRDVGFELSQRGVFVEVHLDKQPPHDTIWPDVFTEE